MKPKQLQKWGIQWRSNNKLDGYREYLIGNARQHRHNPDLSWLPLLFDTRHKARLYCQHQYGYIQKSKDLKIEPHGWKMPRVVKVHCQFSMIL